MDERDMDPDEGRELLTDGSKSSNNFTVFKFTISLRRDIAELAVPALESWRPPPRRPQTGPSPGAPERGP